MAQLQATLKAQYYPTDERITYFLNYIHFSLRHNDTHRMDYKEKYLNPYLDEMKARPEFKFKKDWFKIPDYNTYHFQKALEENNFQYLRDNFKHCNSHSNYNYSLSTVVLDPMCGKAEWLMTHNQFDGLHNIYSIGVELVKERAEICKEKKVSLLYNDAFENIEFPEKSVSLLYFNPPYDSIKLEDGTTERLTKYYLKDILDKNILVDGSYVDLVIREDDFIDCLDLLYENFNIDTELVFKAPQDEYNKFKQIVAIVSKRSNPFKITEKTLDYWVRDALKHKIAINEYVKTAPVIDLTKISIDKLLDIRHSIPIIDINSKLTLFKQKQLSIDKYSNPEDMTWHWFKEQTTHKENKIENLRVALPLKTGEMSNLLASGMINGLIAKNTNRNHIVVGGVEQIQEVKNTISYDDNGKKIQTQIVQKINNPYLNVLTAEGQIIKLINKKNDIIESEDENIE